MADTLESLELELDEIKAAISSLLKGGAAYTINNRNIQRSFTSADLPSLRAYRAETEAKIAALSKTRAVRIGIGF